MIIYHYSAFVYEPDGTQNWQEGIVEMWGRVQCASDLHDIREVIAQRYEPQADVMKVCVVSLSELAQVGAP